MPSRFTGLAPYTWVQQSPTMNDLWDYFDNVPLDLAYVPPAGLVRCTRKPSA